MSKNKGVTLIEMLFSLIIITTFSIAVSMFFFKEQKLKQEINFINESFIIHSDVVRFIKKDLQNSWQNIETNNELLIIKNPIQNCGDSKNIYILEDNHLKCNDITINEQILDSNLNFGFDTNNNGSIDYYSEDFNPDLNLKAIVIENIIKSKRKVFNEKEYQIKTINGEKTFFSDYLLKSHRSFIINEKEIL